MSAINRLVAGDTGGQWSGSSNPLSPYYSLSPQGQANKAALGANQGSLVKRFQKDNKVGPYRDYTAPDLPDPFANRETPSNGGPVSAQGGAVNSAVEPGQTVLDTSTPNPAEVSNVAPEPASSSGGQVSNYDSYINQYFDHAMRTLGPQIEQNEKRFNQGMIDKGFATGSEGYAQEFDNNSRRYNDLLAAAAFNAMGFGADRLDADRGYGLQRDAFDYTKLDTDRKFGLNELLAIDGMNRAWDEVGFRNANFDASREDTQFNRMLSLFGMTPVGSQVPFNTAGAFGNSANAELAALNTRNQSYGQAAQGITDAIGAFGDFFGNRNDPYYGATPGAIGGYS